MQHSGEQCTPVQCSAPQCSVAASGNGVSMGGFPREGGCTNPLGILRGPRWFNINIIDFDRGSNIHVYTQTQTHVSDTDTRILLGLVQPLSQGKPPMLTPLPLTAALCWDALYCTYVHYTALLSAHHYVALCCTALHWGVYVLITLHTQPITPFTLTPARPNATCNCTALHCTTLSYI